MNDDSTEDKLSDRQKRFIGALAVSTTVEGAAKAAHIGHSTAWRFLSNPMVKQAIAERQSGILAQLTDGLLADMSQARKLLVDTINSAAASDGVKVRAAMGVLEVGLRLFEMISLSDRVSELERAVLHEH